MAEAGAGSDLGDRAPQIGEDRVRASARIRGHRPLLLGSTLCAPLYAGKIEEIGEELMPVLRGDALGVELHAVHGIALVLQAHDHAVGGLRGDLQHVGKARPLDHEGVVARGGEVLRDAGKHALAAVMDLRQLAMHQGRRAHHAAAIDLADGLMAEADAEDRHLWPRALDQLEADAGLDRGRKGRATARWPPAPRPAPHRR